MIRSFLPVGQGAFYLEQFAFDNDRLNIVYDCGSGTGVELVRQEIINNFRERERISAVFISHLDGDHINGLEFLLQYCRVENVFFPLISAENRRLILLSQLVKGVKPPDFTYAFIQNPYQTLSRETSSPRFYQIGESRRRKGERDEFSGVDAQVVPSGANVAALILKESPPVPGRLWDRWLYIPFNFRQEHRLRQLKAALEQELGAAAAGDRLLELWGAARDRDKIRKAYKQVEGSFNANSLTLFSGDAEARAVQVPYDAGRGPFGRPPYAKPSGCLYTGDYNAAGKKEWAELRQAYEKYWRSIGCVQIPHHGSRHSYNQEFSHLDSYFIISAGYGNSYRHPHGSVLKDLLIKRRCPLLVTERADSAAHLSVY